MMRIDKSYGYSGYWVNGLFYRVTGHPDALIQMWKKSSKKIQKSIDKTSKEIEILKKYGSPLFPAEIRIKKLEKLNEIHFRDMKHHRYLIDMMKIKRPFTLHALQMIKQGIINDDFKGVENENNL